MKRLLFISAIFISFTLLSFQASKDSTAVTGSYGGSQIDGVVSIQLDINDDGSFRYINNTRTDNPVDVTGTWESNGSKIYLKNEDKEVKMPKKWKLDSKSPCLKASTGLQFIRLCDC